MSGPWVTPSASILAQSVSSSRALDQDVASYYVGESCSWLFGPYCAHSPALTPMRHDGQGGPVTALRITEKTLAWSPKARGQYTRASYLSWSRWSRDTSMDRGSRRGGDAASGAKRVRRFCCGVHAHLGRATCANELDPLDPLQGDQSHTLPTSSSGIPLAEIYMFLGMRGANKEANFRFRTMHKNGATIARTLLARSVFLISWTLMLHRSERPERWISAAQPRG